MNDVLGPVMTGPSSSHTAAPGKIGRSVAQLWGEPVHRAEVVYDRHGSYPNTHVGQGSDYGFAGGLLDLELDDPRVRDAVRLAKTRGVEIRFRVEPLSASHPNEARIDLFRGDSVEPAMSVLSFSTGGGTFRLVQMDGFPVDFDGQRRKYYLACRAAWEKPIAQMLEDMGARFLVRCPNASALTAHTIPSGEAVLFEIEGASLPGGKMPEIREEAILYLRAAGPVVPVPLRLEPKVPFSTAAGALAYAQQNGLTSMPRLALAYEEGLGDLSRETLLQRMETVLSAMERSMIPPPEEDPVSQFLIPRQANAIGKRKGMPLDMGVLNRCMEHAMAVMENGCAHHVVVAAPTAGSSGVIPASVVGVGQALGCTRAQILDALWAAGLVGAFIANQATFGAEVAGCQAEVGAAACMAAAGVVQLMGGGVQEGFQAAGIAMQSLLGLICDPVAGLVEVPCIERNATASALVIMAANMALCGVRTPIPLDETIRTMLEVGQALPASLRCTCEGGLCTTKTGREMHTRVKAIQEAEHARQ